MADEADVLAAADALVMIRRRSSLSLWNSCALALKPGLRLE